MLDVIIHSIIHIVHEAKILLNETFDFVIHLRQSQTPCAERAVQRIRTNAIKTELNETIHAIYGRRKDVRARAFDTAFHLFHCKESIVARGIRHRIVV